MWSFKARALARPAALFGASIFAAGGVGGSALTQSARCSKSESNQGCVRYFAIGSMINPTALSNRGLRPIRSAAAEILDFRLHFYGAAGMAEAIPEAGATFHGVVHDMTQEDQHFLDGIERDLTPASCQCRLYDGTVVDAVVYTRPGATRGPSDQPPGERYLDIIIEGCEHFGVKREYIEWLKAHESVPRTALAELRALELPASLPRMTMSDVIAADGREGRALFVTLNGKVLRMHFPEGNSFRRLMVEQKAAGVHCFEVHSHMLVYDPIFNPLRSQADVTKECAARVEDRIPGQTDYLGGTAKVVGLIDLVYKE